MSAPRPTIAFPGVPAPQSLGACTFDPAAFALDALVTWRADVTVGMRTFEDVVVLDLLRDVARDPARFGVDMNTARQARERFVTQAAQVLEREGGDAAWIEREFDRP